MQLLTARAEDSGSGKQGMESLDETLCRVGMGLFSESLALLDMDSSASCTLRAIYHPDRLD